MRATFTIFLHFMSTYEARSIFETLDGWIRRKIRGILWRQWKNAKGRFRNLTALGLDPIDAKKCAYAGKGPWRMSKILPINKAISNKMIESMGYIPMMTLVRNRS